MTISVENALLFSCLVAFVTGIVYVLQLMTPYLDCELASCVSFDRLEVVA
jgi:hypothetical protein